MRKRKKTSFSDLLSLDSLVDVVTNINGILVLLLVLTAFLSLDKTYHVRLPVARASEKAPRFFECSEGRVRPIDEGFYREEILGETPEEGIIWRPVVMDPDSGDIASDLSSEDSIVFIAAKSAQVQTQEVYFAFFVRPDSFSVFRAARRMLSDKFPEIEIGWEPLSYDRPIEFAEYGKKRVPVHL